MILEGLALGALYLMSKKDPVKKEETPPSEWTRFDYLFQRFGSMYGVDMDWLKAICLNESNLGRAPSVVRGLQNPYDVNGSKSSDGKSWGIMQVTLSTARTLDPLANEVKLNDPTYSVEIAARYLAWLRTVSGLQDKMEYIIKSYNQGPGNTLKEIQGTGGHYADEYWSRFQRNLKEVQK